MVTDAEANAAGDETRREAIDARNQADALIYSVEKTFTENKTKLGAADVGRIDAALEAVKQAVKGEDVAAIRAATSELQQASHVMAEALYKANQGSGGGPQAPHDHAPDVKEGEVVDAEYAETK